MHLLGGVHAQLGGGDCGSLGGVSGGHFRLHLLEHGVAFVLQLCQLGVHVCLLFVGQSAVFIQVGQGIEGPVVGICPVVRQYLEAFHLHPFTGFVPLVDRGGVVQTLGRSFGDEGSFGGAQLIACISIRGQHGIVGHEHVDGGIVQGDPFHRVGDAVLSGNLEDVGLQVPGGADACDVVVAYHVCHGPGVIQGDVGVEGNNLPCCIHVGDGVILGGRLFLGIGFAEVGQGVHHPGTGSLGAVVGGHIVNGVGFLVAYIGAGLFCHGHQILGYDHVVRVVHVNQTDNGHVGLGEHQGAVQLHGHVLGAAGVFHIPGFLVVCNKDAGAACTACVVIDAQQQLHGLLGGGGFAQQHGGDFRFLNACILIRISFGNDIGAADGFRSGNGQPHFIGTCRLIGSVGVGAAAVRANIVHTGKVIILEGGVAVAVLGKGVGETVAAIVHFTGLVHTGGNGKVHLVVAVGNVLRAGKHGGSVRR